MKLLEKIDEYMIDEGAELSKKHFIAIANAIKKAKTLDDLKNGLLDFVKSTNPNFDENRFRKAAGM